MDYKALPKIDRNRMKTPKKMTETFVILAFYVNIVCMIVPSSKQQNQ